MTASAPPDQQPRRRDRWSWAVTTDATAARAAAVTGAARWRNIGGGLHKRAFPGEQEATAAANALRDAGHVAAVHEPAKQPPPGPSATVRPVRLSRYAWIVSTDATKRIADRVTGVGPWGSSGRHATSRAFPDREAAEAAAEALIAAGYSGTVTRPVTAASRVVDSPPEPGGRHAGWIVTTDADAAQATVATGAPRWRRPKPGAPVRRSFAAQATAQAAADALRAEGYEATLAPPTAISAKQGHPPASGMRIPTDVWAAAGQALADQQGQRHVVVTLEPGISRSAAVAAFLRAVAAQVSAGEEKAVSDEEVYLGDGLYASFDGWQIRLIADLGSPLERSAFVEPSVWAALRRYAEGTIERS